MASKTKLRVHAAIKWAEKQRPELLIEIFLQAFANATILGVSLSGLVLLLGMGIFQSMGAFMVFGMFGFVYGAYKARTTLLEAYDAFAAEHPDKA